MEAQQGTDTTVAPAAVIVLAAGEGTRMKSSTPKMLHTLAGRSLLGHVLVAARSLDPALLAVVVRHERDRVAEHAVSVDPDAVVVDQDEIPGTGRAVQCALAALDAKAHAQALLHGVPDGEEGRGAGDGLEGPVVVTAGDTPLLDGGTLAQLLAAHVVDGNAVTMLTTELEDATGYGRVVRDGSGDVLRIVEHKDASADERAIRESNRFVSPGTAFCSSSIVGTPRKAATSTTGPEL